MAIRLMTTKHLLVFLTISFALLPLVLPAQQISGDEPIELVDRVAPEAAPVLELVKDLDAR